VIIRRDRGGRFSDVGAAWGLTGEEPGMAVRIGEVMKWRLVGLVGAVDGKAAAQGGLGSGEWPGSGDLHCDTYCI